MSALALELKSKVAFCAYTGVAANLIHGKTIHNLFAISKIGNLSAKQKNIIIKLLKQIWLLVIDEKSFIGKKFWNYLS